MLAASRKAIISTASKATYATATTSHGLQLTTASNGVKVASSQEPGQTASLAVVVNGGSRAESATNAGVAHFLKNYGFKVKKKILSAHTTFFFFFFNTTEKKTFLNMTATNNPSPSPSF